VSLREPCLLVGCFAAGFLLTAGISLWRSREAGEMLARVAPSPRIASAASPYRYQSAPLRPALPRMNRLPERSAQPAARPPVESTPDTDAAVPALTPETAQQPEQQARRLARRAAERDGH
jgi:hypothetical protein